MKNLYISFLLIVFLSDCKFEDNSNSKNLLQTEKKSVLTKLNKIYNCRTTEKSKGVYCEFEIIQKGACNVLKYKLINKTEKDIYIPNTPFDPVVEKFRFNGYANYEETFYCYEYFLNSGEGEYCNTSEDTISESDRDVFRKQRKIQYKMQDKYATEFFRCLQKKINFRDSAFLTDYFDRITFIEKNRLSKKVSF